MTTFINFTRHEIVVRRDGQAGLWIPPSGTVIRMTARYTHIDDVEGAEVVETKYFLPDGLMPEPHDGIIYIVSSLVAMRFKGRADVVAPDTGITAIREQGRIVAIRRFQRFA